MAEFGASNSGGRLSTPLSEAMARLAAARRR